VDGIASVVPDAHTITSTAVTRATFLASMQKSGVFHFAGHSVFRIDNPGLSYFDLGGDRLYAWELERLTKVPRTVVLASCDSGGAGSVGIGVSGFVSTLVALGVREVVASVVPVPDSQRVSDMMIELHRSLAQGSSAAAALRQIRATAPGVLVHSFQVFV